MTQVPELRHACPPFCEVCEQDFTPDNLPVHRVRFQGQSKTFVICSGCFEARPPEVVEATEPNDRDPEDAP